MHLKMLGVSVGAQVLIIATVLSFLILRVSINHKLRFAFPFIVFVVWWLIWPTIHSSMTGLRLDDPNLFRQVWFDQFDYRSFEVFGMFIGYVLFGVYLRWKGGEET